MRGERGMDTTWMPYYVANKNMFMAWYSFSLLIQGNIRAYLKVITLLQKVDGLTVINDFTFN